MQAQQHKQNGNQHQNGTEKSVEKKLDGSILPLRTAPNPNEEIHGEKHHLPENVEQEEIEGEKNTHHPRIKEKEEREIPFRCLVDLPAYEDT